MERQKQVKPELKTSGVVIAPAWPQWTLKPHLFITPPKLAPVKLIY
jgi:hypothetical protein